MRKIERREGEGGVRGEDVSNQQNHTSAAVPTYLELTLIDVHLLLHVDGLHSETALACTLFSLVCVFPLTSVFLSTHQ